MWVLVFIYLYDAIPYAETVTIHDTMIECFQAREVLSEQVGKGNGYFNAGQQSICINMSQSNI